ncbi:hypothetical protein [Paenibacillus tepidiphilus]|uniref:hypothetical protein n=1 Tax=Paenibacillus tepidiphilus TaxID=2608683 RepID=UPI00123C4331|nr:hypothetical protein [Paenibacillus tepidiphilus]
MKGIAESLFLDEEELRGFIYRTKTVRLGTMGPEQTSSAQVAQFLSGIIKENYACDSIQLSLENNFDRVLESLHGNRTNLILVPNAYEKIKDIYWNGQIRFLSVFLKATTDYGIAGNTANCLSEKRRFQIASCSAVDTLVDQLLPGIEYEIIDVYSTAAAAECVKNNKADLAITNVKSAAAYELSFCSPIFHAKIPWSLFTLAEGN